MGQAIKIPETVSVFYRRAGNVHVFTSPDLRGLHVGHRDLRCAFDLIAQAVSGLVELKFGVVAGYEPERSFDEFLDRLNQDGVEALSEPALTVKKGQSFTVPRV